MLCLMRIGNHEIGRTVVRIAAFPATVFVFADHVGTSRRLACIRFVIVTVFGNASEFDILDMVSIISGPFLFIAIVRR